MTDLAVIERTPKRDVPTLTKPPDSLLLVIERAARDPSIDIDKMERLLQMQERIVARQAEADFNAAMTEAQSEMGRVSADAVNPQTHSKYATYGKLDKVLRPIYTKHGFALSFDEGTPSQPEHVLVICHVSHRAGHSRDYRAEMPADGKGAKGGDVMTKTHAVGAAKQYGMRYLLRGIFNVAIGEEDNDGNATLPLISEKQAADLRALLTEVGANIPAFLKWAKVDALEKIPVRAYETCVSMVRAKGRR